MMDFAVVPYGADQGGGGVGGGGAGRYRECMRNHAAAMGGQVFDGCGEFMAAGADGSVDALKCAACGCHRSFHRRDGVASGVPASHHRKPPPPLPPPPTPTPLLAPAPHAYPHFLPLPYHAVPPQPPPQPPYYRTGSETPPFVRDHDGRSGGAARKRYRTKFTPEQKEKMRAFAEKLGWRIQRHDDGELERFCGEVGVKRHVLKVWMHNHKNHLAGGGGSGCGGVIGGGGAGSDGDRDGNSCSESPRGEAGASGPSAPPSPVMRV